VKDPPVGAFYDAGSHVCVGPGLIQPNAAPEPVEDERDRCGHFWQHGLTFSYHFPVDPGTYQVTLYFAELQVSKAGQRVFDVSIDGLMAISGLDLVQTVGVRTLHIEQFVTDASDGTVDITFIGRGPRSGIINGIVVKPAP
jgi:hypothetical protein